MVIPLFFFNFDEFILKLKKQSEFDANQTQWGHAFFIGSKATSL